MAASTDIWAHENRNAESPQPFSIFEKYLKITRFESAEDELLAQCSIPVDESDLLTVPITLQQHEDSICSADDLLDFDESILQVCFSSSMFDEVMTGKGVDKRNLKQSSDVGSFDRKKVTILLNA